MTHYEEAPEEVEKYGQDDWVCVLCRLARRWTSSSLHLQTVGEQRRSRTHAPRPPRGVGASFCAARLRPFRGSLFYGAVIVSPSAPSLSVSRSLSLSLSLYLSLSAVK